MAEKLSKVLEGFKNIKFNASIEEKSLSKKEKMIFCVVAADVLVSLTVVNFQTLPSVVENMINLCDDQDSDVRMVAEESLNRIITSLSQSDIHKILVELQRLLKKRLAARCLRAILSRFGHLSHYIRPNKGKAHVQMLIPSLIEIAKREEESIHETLASCFENIFKVLGVFVQDNSLKTLIRAFLHNLSSINPVIRRCSASCITILVHCCRKPQIFNSYVLNSLLDCIVPIDENNSTNLILGVLNCLRLLLPNLSCIKNEESISGSFGLCRKQDEIPIPIDRLIQVYELCLYYTNNQDHNVVAAALETLNQVLQNSPLHFNKILLSPAGFSRSYIHSGKENKFWSRSGSEISVAFSLPPADESILLEDSDICVHFDHYFVKDQTSKTPPSSELKLDNISNQNFFKEKYLGKTNESLGCFDVESDPESVATNKSNAPSNFLIQMEPEEKTEDFDESVGHISADELLSADDYEGQGNKASVVDVGNFTDSEVPLIYCARHLAASFLLQGFPGSLLPDQKIRVSVKSLALTCLSSIIKLYPVILEMKLAKNANDMHSQQISDVLLYCNHCDPQIRGSICILIGHFIRSVLTESKGFISKCFSDSQSHSKLNCDYLVNIIIMGLEDKSSVCIRQALSSVKLIVNEGLYSLYNYHFLPILKCLPSLKINSYWLVKVKLIEILTKLPYANIQHSMKCCTFQDEIVDFVLMYLLGDEDFRVRTAAAEGITTVISVFYYGKSTAVECIKPFMNHLDEWLKNKKEFVIGAPLHPPFTFLQTDSEECNFDPEIEKSLSRIVGKLTCCLLAPENKYFLFGCIEALKLLSEKYPPTIYRIGWHFLRKPTPGSDEDFHGSRLANLILSLMSTSPVLMDLAAFSNATFLLGNLFAGLCLIYIKKNYIGTGALLSGQSARLWSIFANKKFSLLAEEIFSHLLKVLNIFSSLLEEATLSKIGDSTFGSNVFLPLLSPIKRQEKKAEDKMNEDKQKNYSFKQANQYAKLRHLLKNAQTNYKVSLETAVGDKFLNLLESNLHSLSIVLEVASVEETGRCAEEILSYLAAVVSLRPCSSITCVLQLLKSLFGTNFLLSSNLEDYVLPSKSSYREDKRFRSLSFDATNIFDLFHLPTELFSEKIRLRTSFEPESLVAFSRRKNRKINIKNTDKVFLATHIRLFEPMVVKSLQLYSITNDVKLQLNVLKLLNQLIQLRVNYCLLDENQVFVDFILKQFDLIEHGQIPGVEALLPDIFTFLVLLSYQRQHSKAIMSIPKIIQLCDGLMASDQSIQTHCIPALKPVVENIFLSGGLLSPAEQKELETQREVVLSMLLRLVEFPAVMDMLALILIESKSFDEKEKWKRWSRQVVDALLPLMNQDLLRIEAFDGHFSLTKLMSALSPCVLRPVDSLLKALFVEPVDRNCCTSIARWIGKATILLETLVLVKEDVLLNRLEEIAPQVNLSTFDPEEDSLSPDPFNVESFFQIFEPAETAARFLLKVMSVVAAKILQNDTSSLLLQQKLSTFFVLVFHVLKSGAFHRIKSALQKLLTKDSESLAVIRCTFEQMIHFYPFLICQYSYFLSLLNNWDQTYWTKILEKPHTLPAKLVQYCGIVCLSDHLCDNPSDETTLVYLLTNKVEELILLSHEIPVKELLATIQKNKKHWSLLMNGLSAKVSLNEPYFNEKALRVLECSEGTHSGALLNLTVCKFLDSPRLAVSLLAGTIACRQVEFLLTLSKEVLMEQIDQEICNVLIGVLSGKRYLKRHLTLRVLLNKLNLKIHQYLLSIEFKDSSSSSVDSWNLKDIHLDENWYFDQVKQRCLNKKLSGQEIYELLSKLSFEKMVEIMSRSEFDKRNLKSLLNYSIILREKCEMKTGDCLNLNESLFRASTACVWATIHEITKQVQQVQKAAGSKTLREDLFDHIFRQKDFEKSVKETAPCLTLLLEIIYSEHFDVETKHVGDLCIFAALCLQIVWQNLNKKSQETKSKIFSKSTENSLKCCSTIIKSRRVNRMLSANECPEILEGLVQNAFSVGAQFVPRLLANQILESKNLLENVEETRTDFFSAIFTSGFNFKFGWSFCRSCIRDLIFNVCRLSDLNTKVLQIPESHELQDVELLENFISKFSVIGWSSRQMFEEIWMGLLSVLGFNTREDVVAAEGQFAIQGIATAVEGITTLLKNTLLDAENNELIHHGRDSLSMKNIFHKMPYVENVAGNQIVKEKRHHFVENLEMPRRKRRYHHGLFSVEYLWTSVKQISSHVDLHKRHFQSIADEGLDLPSCIHLLTELYNQWIHQADPDVRIIGSSLKSALVISDLFTDVAQFQWLQNFCFRVYEMFAEEDTNILPMVISGCCKACAIVLPSVEVCEKVKKIMGKSNSSACRLAAARGLLYLLQSYVVCYEVNHISAPPAGSTLQEEANIVANVVDTFLPVAIDIVNQFKINPILAMEEYNCCHWSLIFYLLQHYPSSLGNFKNELSNFILIKLCDKNSSTDIVTLLTKGLERLLLTTVVGETFKEQLLKASLEMVSRDSLSVVALGLQLLSVLSFLDKRVKDIRHSVMGEDDPEKAMKDMEKVNVLFEKLKKSYPKEAEIVGEVISYVLMDFSASDVLTKVIQEFLSPHQPHQKILAGLLFKVFERAETGLLEDWLVFSLPTFVQGLPIAMSVWTLNCFFVSANSEPWLRYLFPRVQSRIRLADSEDKQLLCLSSAYFYKQTPEFDNLYLDMNSLIHECSHPDEFNPHFVITNENIFLNIFHYLEVLFSMVKPQKLFFLAVDGVAPRAKMNQQRARRFRCAKSTELFEKKLQAQGEKPLPAERFDPNMITPGTVFMYELQNQLKYFITSKISSDPLWQKCQIILSGNQTPGEGEHKIMEYIRYLKVQPDYDPSTRHCLYGNDADLIILGLCTHELHFSILREKVDFNKKKINLSQETEFQLFHLSLMREYLNLEFKDLRKVLSFEYNLEKIIDDWVLMSFLVGNDFIPNLPDLHIHKEAFPVLYQAYKEVLPTLDGYLNENGYLNLPRFEIFMQKLAAHDLDIFEDSYADLAFLSENTGKSFFPDKVNNKKSKKSDLEKLIESTNEMFLDPEEDSFEDEGDTFFSEFHQHKRNYYLNKLDFPKVTEEVLRSHAEDYVKAIQWNLHYYYQGCRSWSWYYPHHYSPYISDITNFKNFKMDFELGKPFLPFEQLLAVLPAASQNFLPEVYRNLMSSPDSPIIDFYPNDFETDLNGKQNDWEAVTLIPFIDEKRLLEAMKPLNEKLTVEELRRNCNEPFSIFSYTDDNLGIYRSPQYFPNITANHALVREVSPEEIAVQESELQYGLGRGVLPDFLHPGFPSLKSIPHTAALRKVKVKVFNFPSSRDSMVITLEKRSCPSAEELAENFLGKIIYVNWPHLKESRVAAVADEEHRFTLSDEGQIQKEISNKSSKVEWAGTRQSLAEQYMTRYAVDVGPTNVLVYVSTLEGRKYSCGPGGEIKKEEFWSSSVTAYPFQIVVTDLAVQGFRPKTHSALRDAFSVGSVVFMLGCPHFGSMARILESPDFSRCGRLNVLLDLVEDPLIGDDFLKSCSQNSYLTCNKAAQRIGIDPSFLPRITGSIWIAMSNGDQPSSKGSKIDIGLNLKFCKKNLELPGYTKKKNELWLYSMKTIDLVSEYVKRFFRVVENLSQNMNKEFFLMEDIFPGPEGVTEMKEVLNWLKNQKHNQIDKVVSGTEVLDGETISELEKILDDFKGNTSKRNMQIKPHLLYKSDLISGNVPPVKNAKHFLLDRVVCVKSHSVPTGLRGFIVGIHKGSTEANYKYDVLFDKPFPGGAKLLSSKTRMFRMSRDSFINITDANRNLSSKNISKKCEETSFPVSRQENGKAQPSAFAQWNQPRTSTESNDRFRQIWSNLQREKPQEGTDVLKKILKIDDEKKPDIEKSVKSFFENLSKISKSSGQNQPEPRGGNPGFFKSDPGKTGKYYIRLFSCCQKHYLGLPRFNYFYLGEKVVAQVHLDDGRICSGLPCDDKESACENASLRLLTALGEIPSSQKDCFLGDKLKKKSGELGNTIQGRAETNSTCQNKIRRRIDVPRGPPDPPSRWIGSEHLSRAQSRTRDRPKRESDRDFLMCFGAPRHNACAVPSNKVGGFQEPKSDSGASRSVPPALEFVPLQAIVGKRSTAAFSKNQTSTLPSKEKQTAEQRRKPEPAASVPALPPGSSRAPNRPRRRPKIAANLALDFNLPNHPNGSQIK